MRYVLASKSPRRRQLLGELVDSFDILTADTDESLPSGMHPREGVRVLAERKGAAVLPQLGDEVCIISSDTLVEIDGDPLGKPESEDDALAMLTRLSGRAHNVHTGVAVHLRGRVYSGVASTAVRFRSISQEEIRAYIATGEPMDKAGSYGIQGLGGAFVEGYDGDFDTVVGLSVALTRRLLEEAENDEG